MRKKIILASWLISLITIIILLVISTAIVSGYRDRNTEQLLKSYSSVATNIYDGTNPKNVNTAVRKNSSKAVITIIDFDDNVIFNSNEYIEINDDFKTTVTDHIGRSVHLTNDNERMIYFTVIDSNHYIVIGTPTPSMAPFILNLFLVGFLVYILICVVSYFVLSKTNTLLLKPLNTEIDKLSLLANGKSSIKSDNPIEMAMELSTIEIDFDEKINNIIDEKEKMEFVIESMNQGILVLDNAGKIILINDFAIQLFKNPKDSVNVSFTKKHYLYLIRNLQLQEYIENTIKTGQVIVVDIKIAERIYLLNLYPTKNKWTSVKDNIYGVTLLILDVTERRNIEHMKRDFFANASHELKSPLTTILGYQQMIQEEIINTPEELNDATRRTIKEAKRMDKILGEMLELSRLESKFEVVVEETNLKEMVLDILDSYGKEILDKNLSVHVDVDDYRFKINRSHCNQLIGNLIDNGIKYNNIGGELFVSLKDGQLVIRDTGIGIAMADQHRVFERFYRVDKGRSKEMGGTGLGLAIVKHICSVYAIKIDLKSDLNKGTEFVLTFNQKVNLKEK